MSSKRFKKLPKKTKDLTSENIEKLLPQIKKNCTTKFDESIDLSFQINNKQKKGEVNIRTVVNLPGGNGKKIKVAVVCEDTKAKEAKDAGSLNCFLEVAESNSSANALYHDLGYLKVGQRKNYYEFVDGRKDNASILAKEI